MVTSASLLLTMRAAFSEFGVTARTIGSDCIHKIENAELAVASLQISAEGAERAAFDLTN